MSAEDINLEIFETNNNELTSDLQHLTGSTIMMVDDEPITMEVVQSFLEDFGYRNFVQIEHSSKAIAAIEEQNPDLLLLDLMMPEVPGFEVLSMVRQHPKFKHLPIIILTGSSDTENKLQALELGATDFLGKPVDQSELGLRVRNTLAAKAYQDQLAYYDPLTNLPNRKMFLEHFDRALKEAMRFKDYIALLNIELDNFDKINDTMGLDAGDEVLRQVARRIEEQVRNVDVLGFSVMEDDAQKNLFRIEGSVFSLFLDRINAAEGAALVAERIVSAIKKPLQIEGNEIYATASIGIATYPTESEDLTTLLRLASSAKDYVKNKSGNSFQFSSQEISTMYEKRLSIESSLRKALDREEFSLHYQPQVDITTGAINGVESLLRWQHNDKGFVSPAEFIPLAEETGLIIPIGEWILNKAISQISEWQQAGKSPISMSINLSPKQFQDPEFFNIAKRTIESGSIDPKLITLEITESLLMDDIDYTIKILNRFKDMGIKLSIDDFGTGYSSLSYLSKMPVDELKIDRSFIKDMDMSNSGDNQAIVSTIIYLAKSLGLTTVAEGVETEEHLNFLKSKKCHTYQGYLFSKPLTSTQLFELLPAMH